MNFNKAIIVGNLTRDPEVKTLPSGQSVTSFGIATNRVWTGQDGNKQEAAEFHNIVAYGKLADICSRYLNKGKLVLIEGRIQTRSWQDQAGNKKYWTEIIAENMQMGPRTDSNSGGSDAPASPAPSSPTNQPSQPAPSQEEIPVIEADAPMQDRDPDQSVGKPVSRNKEKKDTVDVKNIPF